MNLPLSGQNERSSSPPLGILLIGHGTRDERGTDEFAGLAALLRDRLAPQTVENCFLELRQPDIPTGIRQLLQMGVIRVIASPILLFAARHAREDIPGEIRRELDLHSGIELLQTDPLGCHPQLLELADLRLAELLSVETSPGPMEGATHCLVVARGTSDPIARQSIEEFVSVRQPAIEARLGKCEVSLAYVAAAEPRIKDALTAAISKRPTRIVILPHVLFHGEVLGEIQQLAREAAADSGIKIVAADHLAAGIGKMSRGTELLVAACEERIRAKM